ncbi:Ti-type conjugative transfer system protein TraG (plasmid) [Sinorhizobium meliloti WSM1022]|uniref:Ti-type conjugative transfer system protein TraG n=1 Tax=Rhizobium meliloti TaxID=382 RepID=UPI00040569EA|nr:Ti-type conjugative transfer system protein TraG [Sinorhizobium meliloti]MDW9590221.1 Ti-type conjugative transfer system protein TraG [Sinorhizobium meliloti]MDW9844391.1 Ti-type conjugative transfer system protein TraG [Sinorhizobium meliloti]MDX0252957.1 Ti-type conjugative transfer system protein TraG [Sinorhizobium meliloti]QKN18557.1 Ti-type conjugative transfer system protein TraG [Sinorhizobium meliloti WSM1022]QND35549.1 Ti-type conjugative transfer system protein TraG [Sinorhizobi
MALKAKPHPSLLLILLPVAVTAFAIYVVGWRWPGLAAGMSGKTAYWFLRASPVPALLFGPLAGLLAVWALPLHRRRPVAMASLACFLTVAGFYALREFGRLSPSVESGLLSWDRALSYLDMVAVVGAVVGFMAVAVSARISTVVPEPVKRAKRGTFGDADWLPMSAAGKLFPPDGEIVVGERYRVDKDIVHELPFDPDDPATWGKGGKAPLLTYSQDFDSTHMLFFAGSGGYKTTSNVVPTALRYTGPLICLDPSTEVAPMVLEHRTRVLGREVMVLDPTNPIMGFNVLDGIEHSRQKEEDIVGIAHMLLSESVRFESSSGAYFQNQAHNLLTGLLAHVMLSPEYAGRRNLRSLRQIVSEPEPSVLAMLRDIQEHSQSAFIRETLGVFTNMTEQTFSGVYSTASKDTQWLSLDSYAALVCGNAFRSTDIVTGKKDVFLNIPASILRSYPGIGRVIIGSLINAMIQADGSFKRRALFMLDEVDLLGYMRLLEEARDRGRKYGISMMLLYQSLGQLERHFGRDGAVSWIDGCAFASYAAVKALDTARNISAQCGEMTVEVKGSSRNIGWDTKNSASRKSENVNYQRRPLIMPHEITQSMRKDEQIIIVQGHSPIRCGRAIYFRRKDMNEAAKANRFVKAIP